MKLKKTFLSLMALSAVSLTGCIEEQIQISHNNRRLECDLTYRNDSNENRNTACYQGVDFAFLRVIKLLKEHGLTHFTTSVIKAELLMARKDCEKQYNNNETLLTACLTGVAYSERAAN